MALCPYLTVELVTAYVTTRAFEPLSDAAAVNDTYICQFTFTYSETASESAPQEKSDSVRR